MRKRSPVDTENRQQKFRYSLFVRMFLLFSMPLLLMAGAGFGGYAFYSNSLEQRIISDYSENFAALSKQISRTIDEFYNSVLLIELFDEIYYIINVDITNSSQHTLEISAAREILASFNSTRNILQEAVIYFPDSDAVLSGRGILDAHLYFNGANRYGKYPHEFWKNLPEMRSGSFTLLPPTTAATDYGSSSLLPMVIEGIGLSRNRNLLILNIDVKELENMVQPYLFTGGSHILLISPDNKVFLNVSEKPEIRIEADSDLITAVKQEKKSFNGSSGELLLIPFDVKMLGATWTYAAVVPMQEIKLRTRLLRYMTISFIIAGFVFGLIFIFLSSKRMYAPIKEMVSVFSGRETKESLSKLNEFDYLKTQLRSVFSESRKMEQDLSHMLPLAYERCFSQVIKTGALEYYDELKTFLIRQNKEFAYDYFICALIRYDFDTEFYRSFSSAQQNNVQSVLSKMIETHSDLPCRIYHVILEPSIQCSLFNVSAETSPGEIKTIFEKLIASLDTEKNPMQLAVAIGRRYEGLEGIHRSFSNARNRHATMIGKPDDPVQIFSDSQEEGYIFTEGQSSRLKNFLLSGGRNEVSKIVNEIIQENNRHQSGAGAIKLLLFRIYQTAITAAEAAKLPLDRIVPENGTESVSNLQLIETEELHRLLDNLLDNICRYTKRRRKSGDIHSVAAYIQEHYKEDIYLEQLAEQFRLSYKYLSQKFKETLGIPFQQYLTDIRIKHACTLLAETNAPIRTVAHDVGYESTNTFYRVFKKHEGVTASEYRRLYSPE